MAPYLKMLLTSKASASEIKSLNYGAYFEHASDVLCHGSE